MPTPTILTSQLPVSQWHEQMGDPTIRRLRRSRPPARSSAVHLTMTNLERRLKKLEALRTDASGLVPYSPEWFEY
jgi:hypothetical protein